MKRRVAIMNLEDIYKDLETRMSKSVNAFQSELARIRTGRATPALLEGVKVEYYGSQVPLQQIAGIMVPEPRLLVIQPWDKNAIGEIEKAIRKTGLGLNPINDGNVIRIPIPPLSDERRQDLIKLVRKLAEDARVAIRNIRRDGVDKVKTMEKNKEISEDERIKAENEIQKITDRFIEEINSLLEKKEKEILE
jgi:ribosome recycling factor